MMLGRRDDLPDPAPAIRASITPPAGTSFQFIGDSAGPPAITRDGSKVVFGAGDETGVRRLYVRELNGTSRALRGTEGGMFPFWSPDGHSIGFFASGSLRRVDDSGGEVVTLAPARDARGGSWGNDTILFTPDINAGIWAVPASGGKARQITTLETSRHTTHRWPVFLEDGDRFLYFAAAHAGPARVENSGVFSARLTSDESALLLRTGGRVAVAGDQLFFLRDGSLHRQRLGTAGALTLEGEATRVVSRVFSDHTTWSVLAGAADTGVLVFVTGTPAPQALALLDAKGTVLRTLAESESYRDMRLSPDGTKIAFIADSPASPNGDLWVYDIKRGFRTRLTFDAFGNTLAWSPDSSQLAYGSGVMNNQIFVIRADGAGGSRVLHTEQGLAVYPRDWSADGNYLLVERADMPRQTLWALPLRAEAKPFAVIGGDFDHFDGRISPDGRWLAYTSRESGASQVILTTFPKATGKWQVYTTGASAPQWGDNGRTLRFLTDADQALHEARLDVSSGVPVVESVRRLMRPPFTRLANSRPLFEFMRDGTLIAMIGLGDAGMQLHVLSNWRAAAAVDEQ